MIERYNSLRNELGHRFYNGRDPGTIVTTSGNNIYYKPKDCRTADLLGDVNELLWGSRMVPDQISG